MRIRKWPTAFIATATLASAVSVASLWLFSGSAGAQATPTQPTISNIPPSPAFGDSFVAAVSTNGDGVKSVTSNTTPVCTVAGDGLTVNFVAVGSCSLTAHVAAGVNYGAADGSAQTFSVAQATPTQPAITNLPSSSGVGGSFVAAVSTNGDGTKSVTSNSNLVCTVAGDGVTVTFVGVGTCSLTAHVAAGVNYAAASGTAQAFSVGPGAPTLPTISNIPPSPIFGGNFTASVSTNGDGTKSVTSNSTSVCTVAVNLTVSFVGAGSCSLTPHVAAGVNYGPADGSAQVFTVGKATPTAPTITNLPGPGIYNGGFLAVVGLTNGDGAKSVTSNSPGVCTASGLAVSYVGVGTCSLTAQVGPGTNYLASSGSAQSVSVGRAQAIAPIITNLPTGAVEFAGFTADIGTNGDGPTTVSSSTTGVCQVESDQQTVLFLTTGACTLTASVGTGTNYLGATGSPQTFQVGPAPRGYWLVGSDGGIFSFGAAAFHGSMGGVALQRPVVGITPTLTRAGYWLVASDGGLFSFGDANYYGSIPGVGLHPAGSGLPHSLAGPDRGHGAIGQSSRVLHGRVRRRGVRIRRRQVRGVLPRDRRVLRDRGCRHARPHGERVLARDRTGARVRLR